MKIYLIRHGETDQNKVKCLQGRTDIELNAYGKELAHKTAEGLKHIEFEMIFTLSIFAPGLSMLLIATIIGTFAGISTFFTVSTPAAITLSVGI